jgi:hypothetical protein
VQNQLEYDDDEDETQQHVSNREASAETYCELTARIDRKVAVDKRAGEANSAESQTPRAMYEKSNFQCLRLNCLLLKSQNLEVE